MLSMEIPRAATLVQAKIANSTVRHGKSYEVEHAIAKNVLDGILAFRVWHEVADGAVVFRAQSLQALLLGVDLDISIAVPTARIRKELVKPRGTLCTNVDNAVLTLMRLHDSTVNVRLQLVNQCQLVASLQSVALRASSYNAKKTIETVVSSILHGESVVLETSVLITDLVRA